MSDRQALDEVETMARRRLVSLAQAMLDSDLYFFEGAVQVLVLKDQIGGVVGRDPDFDAFGVIASETDHLPLKKHHPLWSSETLARLEPEFYRTEQWASSFAPSACKNLIARFK